jgi:hypothetical protein
MHYDSRSPAKSGSRTETPAALGEAHPAIWHRGVPRVCRCPGHGPPRIRRESRPKQGPRGPPAHLPQPLGASGRGFGSKPHAPPLATRFAAVDGPEARRVRRPSFEVLAGGVLRDSSEPPALGRQVGDDHRKRSRRQDRQQRQGHRRLPRSPLSANGRRWEERPLGRGQHSSHNGA